MDGASDLIGYDSSAVLDSLVPSKVSSNVKTACYWFTPRIRGKFTKNLTQISMDPHKDRATRTSTR